jgi:hypothetical protein
VPSNGGYAVVAAPVGATVQTIPSSAQTVVVNETTNNYYYGGTYYEKGGEGYTVVPPTAGCVVDVREESHLDRSAINGPEQRCAGPPF